MIISYVPTAHLTKLFFIMEILVNDVEILTDIMNIDGQGRNENQV